MSVRLRNKDSNNSQVLKKFYEGGTEMQGRMEQEVVLGNSLFLASEIIQYICKVMIKVMQRGRSQ